MIVEETALDGVLLIRPRRWNDHRGYFQETFRADALAPWLGALSFVQDNQSYSARRGTVRGLHFQRAPFAQGKLIRVVRGAVLDVALDIRPGSASLGRHMAVELSADNGLQLFIPAGFAHGFQTLSDDADVIYKVTAPYAPEAEGGVYWADPALGIDWPIGTDVAVLNDKDRDLPRLADLQLD